MSEPERDDCGYTTADIVKNHGNPVWEAIWGVIRKWDISRKNDGMYSGATGTETQLIFDAVQNALHLLPTGAAGEPTAHEGYCLACQHAYDQCSHCDTAREPGAGSEALPGEWFLSGDEVEFNLTRQDESGEGRKVRVVFIHPPTPEAGTVTEKGKHSVTAIRELAKQIALHYPEASERIKQAAVCIIDEAEVLAGRRGA